MSGRASGTSADVDRYLDELDHPLRAGVVRLREAIVAGNPDLTEHVRWNAPSFRHDGEDRVTFRLHPGARLQLVFHRGARRRDDVEAFTFEDPTGLMTWPARDRAVVDLSAPDAAADHEGEVVELVRRWVRA